MIHSDTAIVIFSLEKFLSKNKRIKKGKNEKLIWQQGCQ